MRGISIFLGVPLFYLFFFLALVVFYVFPGGGHARGIKFPIKIRICAEKGEKPLKMAFFGHFRPFLKVFRTFLKNGSYNFPQTPRMFRGF